MRATPELAIPLALMAIVGTFGFNFQVILPLLARFSFDGGPGVYAALVSAMAVGSVAGALVTGSHGRTGPRLIAAAALAFGTAALLAAAAPALALEIAALVLLGAASVTFAATINSSLQLAVAPQMRGRVMALYSVVFLGSTPDRRPPGRLALPDLRPPLGTGAGRKSPASQPPGQPASASPASQPKPPRTPAVSAT